MQDYPLEKTRRIKPVTLQMLLNEKSILVKDLEDTLLIKHPR